LTVVGGVIRCKRKDLYFKLTTARRTHNENIVHTTKTVFQKHTLKDSDRDHYSEQYERIYYVIPKQ